ncbi:MAG: putative toxin-antitoxin system toxin component, PIN family [Candidatus Aenigmarchaeota archaeon]|nr:putative toxin-antitoxin system toxin component, PIN family [Candidatus Aenigmarchaeota archaeon]
MIRVVLDTNILISAVFWRGRPYEILKHGIGGKYTLIASVEILEELIDRLKNKFGFPDMELLMYVDILLSHVHLVQKTSAVTACRDPKDNKILETALDGNAHYIVTGDPDLLVLKQFQGISIMTASEFLESFH